MSAKDKALLCLIGAMAVGVVAQMVVHQEAAVLGLSAVEIAALGYVVSAFTTRQLTH